MTDFTGPDGGRMALSFAAGCASTWVFVRNLVMKPAIKSCHERLSDLEKHLDEYRDREKVKDARISTLEAVLLTNGTAELRKAMQGALSEVRMEAAGKVG